MKMITIDEFSVNGLQTFQVLDRREAVWAPELVWTLWERSACYLFLADVLLGLFFHPED
jgi:hypothetical protein